MTESQRKKIAEDQRDKILQKMTKFFESVQSLETKWILSVKTLETENERGIFEGGSAKETRIRKP